MSCIAFAVGKENCGSNMGGTKQKLYYAPLDDFNVVATPAAVEDGDEPESEYMIATAHTFKTGKQFHSIDIYRNSGVNNIAPGGEMSGAKSTNTVFKIASKSLKALALFNKFANGITPMIFLAEDANMPDGTYDQIGTEKFGAIMTASKDNGTNDGEGSMYTFTVVNTQPNRLLYTSTVATTPAT